MASLFYRKKQLTAEKQTGVGNMRKIYVVGHKNPDTDSICSAIAYANLKRKITGREYVAKRAGQINEETQYVLRRFKVDAPRLLSDVKLQVKDLDIHKITGVDPGVSIKETWELMKTQSVKTIPVLKDGELVGLISTGDIAKSYMDVYDNTILAKARTKYCNIARTLDGEIVTGNGHGCFVKGKVAVGASTTDTMAEFIQKDDLVILGNRYESQACAVDINASCVVVCQGASIPDELIAKAEEQSIVIITTPHDTFTAARLINQSIPVKYFMSRGPLTVFHMDDYVDMIKEEMTKKKFRDFPILDRHGNFKGFISRRRFLDARKKQVILVDHNEKSQAVDGIEEAEILEIIDHHRLGNIETMGPVFFRNQPVGCTATIVTQMYKEHGVEVDSVMAGLLCSAIISDTLLFRSPTCTELDRTTAAELAEKAGVVLEDLAAEMFNAGSNLKGKGAKEICFQDFKQFTVGDTVFGVGQINSMSADELREIREKLTGYLPEVLKDHKLNMVYFMLTHILNESTELLCCGENARETVMEAFELPSDMDPVILKGVVSRKKQLIPVLVAALQQ